LEAAGSAAIGFIVSADCTPAFFMRAIYLNLHVSDKTAFNARGELASVAAPERETSFPFTQISFAT
jgi:hypothetical protein